MTDAMLVAPDSRCLFFARRRERVQAVWRDRDGGVELAGWLDREATEIVRSALSRPTEGGERPQVVVTVSLPVLQGRIGSTWDAPAARCPPRSAAR